MPTKNQDADLGAVDLQTRISILAENLVNLQTQRFGLDVLQQINGRKDSDPIDGGQPDEESGKVLTYGERRKILHDGEARLDKAYPDLMGAARTMIRERADGNGGAPA